MHFQIKKIILWPRGNFDRREIDLEVGSVNVISGASKTGKSAVIPIVDYCLCASKCAIPVGKIRENCEWFGVVVETVEGEKLFARREPGDQQQTGDMFILEDSEVELPHRIIEKNSTLKQAKEVLNRLSGLSSLGMNPATEGYRSDRTGFRDLMAFTFQPQNIIANPDVLFFKADTTEHREKLKSIFPYILNAVNEDVLAARWELDRLNRVLRQKESALKAARRAVDIWRAEATSWISQAKELGLFPEERQIAKAWDDILLQLRQVASANFREAKPSIEGLEGVLKELALLQKQEGEEALTLSRVRQRLNELRRLIQGSENYGGAIKIQRDRLALSEWLKELSAERGHALSELATDSLSHLDDLCKALEGFEIEARTQVTMSDRLEKEQLRLRQEGEASIARLNEVRQQLKELERRSKEAHAKAFRSDSIERYLGRIEQALVLYEKAGEDAELKQDVKEISGKIEALKKTVSESQIQRREQNALSEVQAFAGQIIPKLDAEWKDAPIKFVKKDLTIKILHDGRDDFLWEIGSGANWLAYHLSLSMAFQRFFLQTPHHPVPSFLVYDQPSQVYFPRSVRTKDEESEVDWLDEDVKAVRDVFKAMSDEVSKSDNRLQIIVLDHADNKVWGDIEDVNLVAEWRNGEKLVPPSWYE